MINHFYSHAMMHLPIVQLKADVQNEIYKITLPNLSKIVHHTDYRE